MLKLPYNCTHLSSVQFSCSVMSDSLRPHESQHARSPCPLSTPGVYTTLVHRVGDAIQASHSLSSPSPPAPNPSQHQSLFQWVNSSHHVAKVLEFQLQHQFFQWIFRTDFLWDGLLGSPCCSRDSQESPPTPQFKSTNSSVLSFPYSPALTFGYTMFLASMWLSNVNMWINFSNGICFHKKWWTLST